jgi:hypothetical protein
MSENNGKLELLRKPFQPNQISKLPKPYKSDSPKGNCKECGGYHGLPALHLDYVGHAALTDRLLDVDPGWTWEPLALDDKGLPAIDKDGGLWIKLTVCGVTRLGYGDAQGKTGGNAMKERIGDALRNAAMRFGAALDLWHKGELHADDEPEPPSPVDLDKLIEEVTAKVNLCKSQDELNSLWADATANLDEAARKRMAKPFKRRQSELNPAEVA